MLEQKAPAGFGIIDLKRGQLYIPRLWASAEEAEAERAELLRGYPPDHEWAQRLKVAPWWTQPPRTGTPVEGGGERKIAA